MRLFTRKECWVPTARGWLALAVAFLGGAALAIGSIHGFLSPNDPVPAEVLILEPWLADYALQDAVGEIKRGGYRRVIKPGAGLLEGWEGSSYQTGA
jgi:hypothetical protein